VRYFIRKSILDLKENNPELFNKILGTTELFMFSDKCVISDKVTIGDEPLVEIKLELVE
jgi:hypothetical protein